MDRSALKQCAKEAIARDRLNSIAVAFIMVILTGITGASSTAVGSYGGSNSDNFPEALAALSGPLLIIILVVAAILLLLRFLVVSVIKVGGLRFFLKLRCDEKSGVGEILGNFKDGNYVNIFTTALVRDIKVFLWSLLLVIPGIIKSYEYFAIDYILATRPDIDRKSAFQMSKVMMDGKKLELFVLNLSFIGWNFLNLFTCGILGIVYIKPYIQATFAEFFAYARDDAVRNGKIDANDLPDYGTPSPAGNQFDIYNSINNGFNTAYDGKVNYQPYTNDKSVYDDNFAQNTASQIPVVEADSTVNNAPVSEAPVSEAPVSEAPVSEAPVSEAPVSEAPVSEAPVSEAPVVTEQTYSPYIPENAPSSDNNETNPS